MICFRGMTFCPFHEDCANAENCPYPLTEEAERQAREWWGGDDAPISRFMEKPDCHVLKEK